MKRELRQQLERLGQERQRLETVLARQPAWITLDELLRRQPPSDDYGRYALARRRASLEAELAGDPVYAAHRSVMAAIQVIERLVGAAPPADAPAQVAVALSDPDTEVAVSGLPDGAAPRASAPAATEVQLLTLGGGHGDRVVTRAATIHHGPPGRGPESSASALADAPPDQLTRIRRIDKGLAAALIARGVRHFAQIAAFGPADVRSLSAALGLGRRISQENWIEQAALLAMKAGAGASVGMPRSAAASHAGSTEPPPSRTSADFDAVMADAGREAFDAAMAAAAAVAHANRRGAVPLAHATLKIPVRKVVRHASPMQGQPPDEATTATSQEVVAAPLPDMSGLVQDIARRIGASARAPAAESVPPEQSIPLAKFHPISGGTDVAALPPAEPEPPSAAPAGEAVATSPEPVAAVPDDLTLIAGIDDKIADRLSAAGIDRFATIAAWDAATVNGIAAMLGLGSAIARQGWIEQSALLARGTTTAYAERVRRGEIRACVARPDAPAARDTAFTAWLAAHTATLPVPPPTPVVDDIAQGTATASKSTLEPGEGQAPEVAGPSDMPDLARAETTEVPHARGPAILVDSSSDIDDAAGGVGAAVDVDDQSSRNETADEIDAATIAAERVEAVEAVDAPAALRLAPDEDAAIEPADAVLPEDGPAEPQWRAIAAQSTAWPPVTFDEPPPGAPGAPTTEVDHAAAYDTVPPPHERPVARQLSIADRITAIEREAADLPLSPRAALARFRDPTRAPSGRSAVAEAASPSVRRSVDEPAHAGADVSGYGEADVRIVMREAHAAGLEPRSDVPRHEASAAVGLDPQEYAAYRGTAEEASVEIVSTPAPADAADDAHAVAARTRNEQAAVPRATQESGKVRRFLKALTGD